METVTEPAPLTHFIVMTRGPGYWGRGITPEEAIINAVWLTAGHHVRLIHVDQKAYVNEMGELIFNNREHLGEGDISADGKHIVRLKKVL